jgi:hypothetical protein
MIIWGFKKSCCWEIKYHLIRETGRTLSNSLFEVLVFISKAEKTSMQRPHNLKKGYLNDAKLNDAKHSLNTNKSLINGLRPNEGYLNSLMGENIIFRLSS